MKMSHKRVLSILLAVVMLLGLVPAGMAFEAEAVDAIPLEAVEETAGIEPADNTPARPGRPQLSYGQGIFSHITGGTNDHNAQETKGNILDGRTNTKWLSSIPEAGIWWVSFAMMEPFNPARYYISSANDAPERDPRDWVLYGRATVGTGAWVEIDSRADHMFTARFQTHFFEIDEANRGYFQEFRLRVIERRDGRPGANQHMQFSRIGFAPPLPEHMNTGRFPTIRLDTTWRVGRTNYQMRNDWHNMDFEIFDGQGVSIFGPGIANPQMRGRGNSTWANNTHRGKVPFRIRFNNTAEHARYQDPWGAGHTARHWTFLADAFDRSHMRNYSAFHLTGLMNNVVTPWAQHVHVYEGDDYRGVYLASVQHNEVRPGRVDLVGHADPTISEYYMEMCHRVYRTNQTGNDFFVINQGRPYIMSFELRFPDALTAAHNAYARDFIARIDRLAREGNPDVFNYIDMATFVDFMLVQDLYKNPDVGFSSVFMHIRGQGADRRLHMGILWDFDISAGLADYQGTHYKGRGIRAYDPPEVHAVRAAGYRYSPQGPWASVFHQWYRWLMEFPAFADAVNTRWQEIRDAEVQQTIDHIWDTAIRYSSEFDRNFDRWPILGQGVWPSPAAVNAIPTHLGHVAHLTDWLEDRVAWLDTYYADRAPDAFPVITIDAQPAANTTVTLGEITGNLTVAASVTEGAVLSYQWYSNTTAGNTGGTPIPGATSATFPIPTTLPLGTHYFYVVMRATDGALPLRSGVATVTVIPAATTPVITITEQPAASTTFIAGEITGDLTVAASVTQDATLSFQWYSNTTASNTGGTPITGATSATFAIPTALTRGTHHFYVVVSATDGALSVASDVATVVVTSPPGFDVTLMALTQPENIAAEPGNRFSATSGVFAAVSHLTGWDNGVQQRIGSVGSAARTPIVFNNGETAGGRGWRGVGPADIDAGITIETASAWQVRFETTGYENIRFSAQQKSTGSGPNSFALAYSLTGPTGPFIAIPGSAVNPLRISNDTFEVFENPLTHTYVEFALPAAVANQGAVYLRVHGYNLQLNNPDDTLAQRQNGNTSINNIVVIGDLIPAPVITIDTQPAASTTVTAGEITGNLNVAASVTEGATLSYQWYAHTPTTAPTPIVGATSATFAIPTTLTPGTHYFYVVVSATGGAVPVRSGVATVTVVPGAATPVITITEQPAASTTFTDDAITGNLTVAASVTPNAAPAFQWYSNTTADNTGGTPIAGATSATFAIPTTLARGTHHFYVVVSASGAASVASDVATVVVTPPEGIDVTLMSLTRPENIAADVVHENWTQFNADSGVFAAVSHLTGWDNGIRQRIGPTGSAARTPIVFNNGETAGARGWHGVGPAAADAGITIETATAWQVRFETTGYENIRFSAQQKSTGSGPDSFALAYSLTGPTGPFIAIPNSAAQPLRIGNDTFEVFEDPRTHTYVEFALPAAVADQGAVYLRVYCYDLQITNRPNGNTSINNIVVIGDLMPPSVDRTALAAAVDAAEDRNEADYTPASWAAFADALAEARGALADTNATQQQIDDATEALTTAQAALVTRADLSALQAAVTAANQRVEADYTPNSWTPFVTARYMAAAFLAAPNLNATQGYVDALTTALTTAQGNLVSRADFTALQATVEEAHRRFGQPIWPPVWWPAFAAARDAAEAMLANPNATQAEVDAATAVLISVMDAFCPLQAAVNAALPRVGGPYTPATYASFRTALTGAQAVLATIGTATQAQIHSAADALIAATAALTPRADLTALQAAVTAASQRIEVSYTPASWTPFADALTEAQTALADINASQQQIDTATTTLTNAMDALTLRADLTALQTAVTAANQRAVANYTPNSWTPFTAARTEAAAFLANPNLNATQGYVSALTTALNNTMTALIPRADLTALQTAIIAANRRIEINYTPNSWTPFADTRDAAAAFLATSNLNAIQADVDALTTALTTAQGNLTSRADLAALQTAVTAANQRETINYTSASRAPFEAALAHAQTVLRNANATQQQVDAAETVLRNAIAALAPVFPDTMNWARSYVLEAYARGIVLRAHWCDHYDDYIFMPSEDATRAMAADFIWRTAGAPAPTGTAIPFTDVTADDWFIDAVLWAHENNIIRGRAADDGTFYFAPDDTLERRELSTMLKRLAGYFTGTALPLPPHPWPVFNDHDDIGWAEPYIRWNFAIGLLQGDDYGNVHPQRDTERAEAVTTVVRFARVFAD